ncbi:unnamed protein product [Eruca vesicaria subsp. sativa]|uniref:Uncharacterized protein n=1 Tax=Eruca vesicaria subsp. sativa TaxID=29727 RepID=A0ABC8J334_ERUVS|nr:unnamed protein product [Eruca vesicaria subsp. sativa]
MMVNEFSRIDDPKIAVKPSPAKTFGLCRLYFKGMVNEDSFGGLGIAICGEKGVVLFQMKTPIFGSGVTELEAELRALKQGLTEAVGLGITHISIYCDYDIRYAYTLARETTVYETRIRIQVDLPPLAKSTQKTTCIICLDEDINADQMFYVDKCRHRFCTECVRRHIEVGYWSKVL